MNSYFLTMHYKIPSNSHFEYFFFWKNMFSCLLKVSWHSASLEGTPTTRLCRAVLWGFVPIPPKPGEWQMKFSEHSETFQLSLKHEQMKLLWQEQMYLAFLPWTVSTTAASLALVQSVLFETYVVIFLQKKHSHSIWAEVTQIHWAAKQRSNFSSFLYDRKRKIFLKSCDLTVVNTFMYWVLLSA